MANALRARGDAGAADAVLRRGVDILKLWPSFYQRPTRRVDGLEARPFWAASRFAAVAAAVDLAVAPARAELLLELARDRAVSLVANQAEGLADDANGTARSEVRRDRVQRHFNMPRTTVVGSLSETLGDSRVPNMGRGHVSADVRRIEALATPKTRVEPRRGPRSCSTSTRSSRRARPPPSRRRSPR